MESVESVESVECVECGVVDSFTLNLVVPFDLKKF